MSNQELKAENAFHGGDSADFNYVIMDPIPKQAIEGEVLLLSGNYHGPPIEKLAIFFIPAFNDIDETKNSAITLWCRFTQSAGGGRRLYAELRAPRGRYYISIVPFFVGHQVHTEVYNIEFISACAGRVMRICNSIFPKYEISFKGSEDILPHERLKKLTPQALSTLIAAVDDILLAEHACLGVVTNLSLSSNADPWKVMLQLSDEVLRQHENCYQALQPFHQHLLNFLPPRMWQMGFQVFCRCLLLHGQTGLLHAFLDKAQSTVANFRTTAPSLEKEWDYITNQLQGYSAYCPLRSEEVRVMDWNTSCI